MEVIKSKNMVEELLESTIKNMISNGTHNDEIIAIIKIMQDKIRDIETQYMNKLMEELEPEDVSRILISGINIYSELTK